MRWWVVALALAACKKDVSKDPPRPAQGLAGSASAQLASDAGAAVATGDAGAAALTGDAAVAAEIDLLHAIPTKLVVSSVVANPKLSPWDLVDGDLTTAWNSKSGQLVGAWIAVRVPPSTKVTAFKLTAGFTSKGPEGDYFTLNPRIKKVAVWHDGIRLGEHELDINSRALQTVPANALGGDYKLEVTAIEPGTNKKWRETCISELQVIGTPPPGLAIETQDPVITVASFDAKPVAQRMVKLEEPIAYADEKDFCAFHAKRTPPSCQPWENDCRRRQRFADCGGVPDSPPALPAMPGGWKARWLETSEDTCNLVIEAKGKTFVFDEVGGYQCGQEHGRFELRVAEVLGDGGEPELVYVHTALGRRYEPLDESTEHDEVLLVCAVGATGTPRCTRQIVGRVRHVFKTAEDGLDEWVETRWQYDYAVGAGMLGIAHVKGKPESYDDALDPGRYRLRIVEPSAE